MVALPVRRRRQGQQESDPRLVLDVRDRQRPFQPGARLGVPIAHDPVHGQGDRDARGRASRRRSRSRSPRPPGGCRSPHPSPRRPAPPARPHGCRRRPAPRAPGTNSRALAGPRRPPHAVDSCSAANSWIELSNHSRGSSSIRRCSMFLSSERLEHVGIRTRDRLRRREAAPAGEHGQPIEDGPLLVRQQVVAPRDRGAKRCLARVRITPASQQIEPGGQPLEELFDREELQPWSGELECERKPVEPLAHGLHVGAGLDRDAAGRGPRHEELHRIVGVHGRHREFSSPPRSATAPGSSPAASDRPPSTGARRHPSRSPGGDARRCRAR